MIARVIDALNEWIGRAVAWCAPALVLTAFSVVLLRYGLGIGSAALQEAVSYLHAILFMAGAAWTLRHDGHVRVDIFYRRFGPRGRAAVNLLGSLFLLIPVCAFILWSSLDYVAASWSIREGSREAGGLPFLWLLKTLIPVSAALLLLQGISLALHSLRALTGREAPPVPAHEEKL